MTATLGNAMDGLKKDLLYTLRMLSRERGTTLLVVLTLALGIGATTAIFSAIRGSLLADPPYRDADELVMVWVDNEHPGIRTDITSYPSFEKTREQATKLEDLGVVGTRILVEGEPLTVVGVMPPGGALPKLAAPQVLSGIC